MNRNDYIAVALLWFSCGAIFVVTILRFILAVSR